MNGTVESIFRVQRRWPILQLLVLALLFAFGASTISGFAEEQSIRSMLVLAALLGLAAAGQTLVVLVGGLDLSVPGIIVMGAVMVSELCGTQGWAFGPALCLIVVIAALMGATVGFLCHRYRIVPLIATLAMGAIAAGAVTAWTNGELSGAAPQFLSQLAAANGTTLGLPIGPVVVIWAAVALLIGLLLRRTVAGRWLYAAGANARAADLALVPTRAVWIGVFATSAVLSSLVGVLLAGFSGATTTVGDPYLFQGLTAVLVGGTVLGGARGDYTHTAVGAMILTVLTTILVGNGYDPASQQVIFGALILLAIAGYGRDRRLRDRV